jgi:C-terminal processing protease CtpA/Prc
MTLVDRSDENGRRSYRYRLEFTNAIVLQHFVLDGQNKLAASKSEAWELKPGVILPEAPSAPVVGIGVALDVDGDNIIVRGIVPGSPAATQKDLHVGDRIIAVAQDTGPAVPVHGGKAAQAIVLIRGPAGTTVRLTIVSSGEDDSRARVVSFVRAEIKVPPR